MKNVCEICIRFILIAGFTAQVSAQEKSPPESSRPLVLTEAIPLPGVQGRFDHFGFDRKNQLFVAALGNNSVEVIDIGARTRVHSITGIPNPQGVVYAPETRKLFAASSEGQLYIYDAATLELVKAIDFHGDVDNSVMTPPISASTSVSATTKRAPLERLTPQRMSASMKSTS